MSANIMNCDSSSKMSRENHRKRPSSQAPSQDSPSRGRLAPEYEEPLPGPRRRPSSQQRASRRDLKLQHGTRSRSISRSARNHPRSRSQSRKSRKETPSPYAWASGICQATKERLEDAARYLSLHEVSASALPVAVLAIFIALVAAVGLIYWPSPANCNTSPLLQGDPSGMSQIAAWNISSEDWKDSQESLHNIWEDYELMMDRSVDWISNTKLGQMRSKEMGLSKTGKTILQSAQRLDSIRKNALLEVWDVGIFDNKYVPNAPDRVSELDSKLGEILGSYNFATYPLPYLWRYGLELIIGTAMSRAHNVFSQFYKSEMQRLQSSIKTTETLLRSVDGMAQARIQLSEIIKAEWIPWAATCIADPYPRWESEKGRYDTKKFLNKKTEPPCHVWDAEDTRLRLQRMSREDAREYPERQLNHYRDLHRWYTEMRSQLKSGKKFQGYGISGDRECEKGLAAIRRRIILEADELFNKQDALLTARSNRPKEVDGVRRGPV